MNSQPPTYDFLDPPEKEGEIGRLGPYRVTGLLGKGGMGQVFRAEDSRLKRSVALKVMNRKFAATPNSRKRFVEEARSMAAIHHDNVATIFEVGIRGGTPFMAMEMLKGKTLEACRGEGKHFSADEILKLTGEVAAGLAAAHSSGIIHRDVKPANIWIEEPSGRAKILDFGLALAGDGVDRFSRLGSVVGTPGYLAPEQARNEPVDDRTDLYSLGVVLYQLCTGKLPLVSDTIAGQLIAIISHPPRPIREVNPEIPEPLADLVDRLLAKEPRDRPPSANVLQQQAIDAAQRCRGDSQVALQIVTASPAASQNKPAAVAARVPLHNRGKALIVAALLLLLVGLAGWKFMSPGRVASPVAPADQTTNSRPPVVPVVVTAESLRPLQLTPVVAASSSVESGNAARFQMRMENIAIDAKTDPRRINSKAPVAAQIVTFLKGKNGVKRKAPVYPKRFSPAQLPQPGESKQVEILFFTRNLSPGDFEVIFELHSPGGSLINSVTSQVSVTENLGAGDLLGFESLRTHAGGGSDTYVSNKSSDDFGAQGKVHVHHRGGGNSALKEHAYLRFDLSKSPVPKDQFDRAVLLLTVTDGGHQSTSTITAYGVSAGLPDDWAESGPSHLSWQQAPSRSGVESLRYLAQLTIDNSGNALKDVVDGVRIYGANLDDFLRTSPGGSVTILLVRESKADKPTCFSAKEGKPQQAPALALRRR